MPIRLRTNVTATVYVNAANHDSVEEAEKAVRGAVTRALSELGSDIYVGVDIKLATV